MPRLFKQIKHCLRILATISEINLKLRLQTDSSIINPINPNTTSLFFKLAKHTSEFEDLNLEGGTVPNDTATADCWIAFLATIVFWPVFQLSSLKAALAVCLRCCCFSLAREKESSCGFLWACELGWLHFQYFTSVLFLPKQCRLAENQGYCVPANLHCPKARVCALTLESSCVYNC